MFHWGRKEKRGKTKSRREFENQIVTLESDTKDPVLGRCGLVMSAVSDSQVTPKNALE